jgi:hypothetical protein
MDFDISIYFFSKFHFAKKQNIARMRAPSTPRKAYIGIPKNL